jgi:CRISPR-associated exonuclease Cas4
MMVNWGGLFVLFFALALIALWLARQSRAATGLPAGRLVLVDTTRWHPVDRPLFSRSYHLTGRPDYLVQRGREMIPVEVKSGSAPPSGPYVAHILQLITYCLLVEETYDHRPSFGIILYAQDTDQAFEIDYTPALEQRLLAVVDKMRTALAEGDAPRDHHQIARCQACGYRNDCDQQLV